MYTPSGAGSILSVFLLARTFCGVSGPAGGASALSFRGWRTFSRLCGFPRTFPRTRALRRLWCGERRELGCLTPLVLSVWPGCCLAPSFDCRRLFPPSPSSGMDRTHRLNTITLFHGSPTMHLWMLVCSVWPADGVLQTDSPAAPGGRRPWFPALGSFPADRKTVSRQRLFPFPT